MAYQFVVQNVYKNRVDGVITGALIVVRCDRKDDATDEITGSTTMSWEAEKAEFAAWPPSREQCRDYIVGYLEDTPPGWGQSRVDVMKAATAVLEQSEEVWAAAEKVLPIT